MSAGEPNNGLNLDDEDRLPWLEPAGIEEETERVSPIRIVGLTVLGLVLLGVIVAGGYLFSNRDRSGSDGSAPLIAAENKDYKVPANASDARTFDGEGDEAFAASEGREASGRIDASRVPEAPRDDLKQTGPTAPALAVPAERPAAKPTVIAPVKTASTPKPAAPAPAKVEDVDTLTGPRVQLGAFASRAIAEEVWKKQSGRFDYLSALKHSVEPVETGGRTLYRLRASVASPADATATCGRLRVAGENCIVVR
ncbi:MULTISPECIES: SPOR domain-containing protein [unclassified Sphingobium]|uniref:SPOR domain-containing protein n=1 Tax=unclassified Sphingobium TaxID=2611147 RepID=UPI002223FBD0|nr:MULTISPECIES: SPOR domain-containing protein [unclassified Sphingobium]MCW2413038.1 cell division protein FtsN [Sphingobium sp. B8D3D]MCW2414663.1 cell division protein FtsN [Sphingobium sp. B8D3A]